MNMSPKYKLINKSLHIDWPLLSLLFITIIFGLFILYSAANSDILIVIKQITRLICAVLIMLIFAVIPPHKYKRWTHYIYFSGLFLLIAVMIIGKIGKGAQRWLDLGIIRFQPSEIMKLAVPMMTAWYFDSQYEHITMKNLLIAGLIIFIPAILIAKQPDLGTAIMVIFAGLCVVFLAGISFKFLIGSAILVTVSCPIVWHFMHTYQKQRIYTLFNQELDPLGASYHIIQSKIAIGSGGGFGKGWLYGSQSHLNFLPEHATDFIFSVSGEEFGFLGSSILIILFILLTIRGLRIAAQAQTKYTYLLVASLIMTFFFSVFVNVAMVMGILPVVGMPLPLISYGGTAMVTFLASFGILMSVSSHRILFTSV